MSSTSAPLGHNARKAKWDRLADTWVATEPPAIPSAGDLRIVKQHVKAAFQLTGVRRAVVLGATWGLRTVLQEPDLLTEAVYCIDWSRKMYIANTRLMDDKVGNEKFLQRSWTDFEVDEPASIVVGDKVLDNLPAAEWPVFFSTVAHALVARGSLIVHCAPVLVRATPQFSVARSLEMWATRISAGKATVAQAASGFWEDLLTASASKGDDKTVLTISKFQTELAKCDPAGPYEKQLLQTFWMLFGTSISETWCGYTLDEIYRESLSLFDKMEIEAADDYDAAPNQPTVILRKHQSR